MQQVLGPLGGTMPHAMAVMALFGITAVVARLAGLAISEGRALLLLACWASGMTSFVAGCAAFQGFAWNEGPLVDPAAAAAIVRAHGVPLACVLLLGALAAAGIELTGGRGRAWRGRPSRGQTGAEAVGLLGEGLVSAELRRLGWPQLRNVVLVSGGRSSEIDHLVRAPDGIVVIETKTLSGYVWGQPGGELWSQHAGGEVRRFQNPLSQNEGHMAAVRAAIGGSAVCLRGLVVSAGRARFAEPIAGCVVPVAQLAGVLRSCAATPLSGQGSIERAWAVLEAEAARSADRQEAHVAYARSRRRGHWFASRR